jgi:beta-ribofuranosylaminobenzene 5'-phosphate synthase
LYGGAGIAIDGPGFVLLGRKSAVTTVSGAGLTQDECVRLQALVAEACGGAGTHIEVVGELHRHIGLGSGTALRLGALTLGLHVHGIARSPTEIGLMSRRGGTSGIGWHAFWKGGFILDGGQPNRGQPIMPSSGSKPLRPPPLLLHARPPRTWVFTLIMPRSGQGLSGMSERRLFRDHTPTSRDEFVRASETLRHAVVAGVRSGDIRLFAEGMRTYQGLGFKRAEIAAQPAELRQMLAELGALSAVAGGMSSVGPLVFTVHDEADSASPRAVAEIVGAYGARVFAIVRARDFGHVLDGEPVRSAYEPASPSRADVTDAFA